MSSFLEFCWFFEEAEEVEIPIGMSRRKGIFSKYPSVHLLGLAGEPSGLAGKSSSLACWVFDLTFLAFESRWMGLRPGLLGSKSGVMS